VRKLEFRRIPRQNRREHVHEPALFDDPTSAFDRARLAADLRKLADESIYLGGSSWKYEGWLDQIYTPQRYYSRGKFSQKLFEQRCLAEYAETFPIVCGDFSFYQFPTPEFWTKLFESAPGPMKFAFKVPEEITCKTYPNHPRYGPKAGQPNPNFLSPEMFEEAFLQLLEPYRERIAVFIFEFGTFSKKSYLEPKDFFTDLEAFLSRLPAGWRYSVEIRNEDYPRSGVLQRAPQTWSGACLHIMEPHAAPLQANRHRRGTHSTIHSGPRPTTCRPHV
jgi:uncharacterized protein YecE (DUF72 family)